MDHETCEARARQILAVVFRKWDEAGSLHEHIVKIETTEDGEPIPIFGGSSPDGNGTFQCAFAPLDFARKALLKCEELLLSASFNYDFEGEVKPVNCGFGDLSEAEQARVVDNLATTIVVHLLGGLRKRLCELFDEASDEAFMQGDAMLTSSLAQTFRDNLDGDSRVRLDGIDEEIEKAAKRKRERLAASLNKLPLIHVSTGRGRPPGTTKSAKTKALEALEFEHQIEEAYKSLLASAGKPPTKTAVAKSLGISGTNPRTGTNSILNRFNNKLSRLALDYNAITAKLGLHK